MLNRVNTRIGLRDSVSFCCPFCTCGTVTGGIDEDDVAIVAHTAPKCEKYNSYTEDTVGEFLRECKASLKAKDRKLS